LKGSTVMLTAEQIRTFKTRGYVKGPKILSDEQTDVLREEVLRVIADRDKKDQPQPVLCHNMSGNADAPVWQVVNIWMASEPFKQRGTSDVVASLVAELIDAKELRIWHDQIQYKPASG